MLFKHDLEKFKGSNFFNHFFNIKYNLSYSTEIDEHFREHFCLGKKKWLKMLSNHFNMIEITYKSKFKSFEINK